MAEQYNPAFAGSKVPLSEVAPLPMTKGKLYAADRDGNGPDAVVNLGIGMPPGVGVVCAEESLSDNDDDDGRAGSNGRSARADLLRMRRLTRSRCLTTRTCSTSTMAADSILRFSAWPRWTSLAMSMSASSVLGLPGQAGSSISLRVPLLLFSAGPLRQAAENRNKRRRYKNRE